LRRAILLRHASALDAKEDALRALSPRGAREARRAGEQIAALGADWAPALSLCSSAARATATLAQVEQALAPPPRREIDARLYLASAGELLAALQRAPEAAVCLLVVAHEPGLSALVRLLARSTSEAARAGFARGMPPGAFAALALDVARWSAAGPRCAELAAFARADEP
jgi:phosphohistidine phosphatase